MEQKMDDHFQDQLRAYLQGQLNAQDRARFVAQVQAEPQAAQEMREAVALTRALRAKELLNVQAAIQTGIGEDLPPQGGWRHWLASTQLGFWLGGLLVVGILAVGGYWWMSVLPERAWQSYTNQALVPLEVLINTGQHTDAALDNGIQAYEKGQYRQAATLLGGYFGRTQDPYGALFGGVAELLDAQPRAARPLLEAAIQNPNELAAEAARWYLALAWLETGDTGKAKLLLDNWPAQGLYSGHASELNQLLEEAGY